MIILDMPKTPIPIPKEYAVEILKEVEDFIQHLRDGDYIIDSKSYRLKFSHAPLVEGGRKQSSLPELISDSITMYELMKSDPYRRFDSACQCLIWINKARAFNLIKEGEGLLNKFKECSEKNTKLEIENAKLREELAEDNEKNKAYEGMLPHFEGDIT